MTSIKVKKIAISSLTISMLILVTGMCFGQNTQRQKGKRCCESKYEQNQLDSLNLVELWDGVSSTKISELSGL